MSCRSRYFRPLTSMLLASILLASGVAGLAIWAALTVSPALRHDNATPPRVQVRRESAPILLRASSPVPVSAPPKAAAARAVPSTKSSTARHAGRVATAAATRTDPCAVALTYLAAHAKPGYAHYCRPEPLQVGIAQAVAFTCVPGSSFRCPDGVAEIIIAEPTCAISYENEASNSYWDFSSGGVITPSTVQNGRTWDPYGSCH